MDARSEEPRPGVAGSAGEFADAAGAIWNEAVADGCDVVVLIRALPFHRADLGRVELDASGLPAYAMLRLAEQLVEAACVQTDSRASIVEHARVVLEQTVEYHAHPDQSDASRMLRGVEIARRVLPGARAVVKDCEVLLAAQSA